MKNIDEDFDVFLVEKSKEDYYKYNILDSPLYDFNALAVQWSFGAKAFVLFRKGEATEQNFKKNIMQKYNDVKIQKIDVFNSEQCYKNFWYNNRLLAQLLINSIKTPTHKDFMYNNLTGKLFYHDPEWKCKDEKTGEIIFIRFLEVVIDPGMYLNFEHKTFRRTTDENCTLYVIDPKTGEFRKKHSTDKNITTYKEGSLKHSRFTVTNLSIKSYDSFKKCKMGIMEQFLSDVREKLSKYLTIEITERKDTKTYAISNLEKKGISDRDYGEMIRKRGIVIVDENDTEKSKDMVEKLKNELQQYYGVEASVGRLSEQAYNIRIIHHEDYYDAEKIADAHDDGLKGYIVQHIAEEADHFTNSNGASPDIKKILQELIIKGDVRDRAISIFDWKRISSGKTWSFVIRQNIKEKEDVSGKKVYYQNYYRLQIDENGRLNFDNFCDKSSEMSGEWEEICCKYDLVTGKSRGIKNQVEGLFYTDIDNIHAIILTKEKTIPNTSEIKKALKETNIKEKVSKQVLLKAIDDFEANNPKYSGEVSEWKCKLSDEPEIITKKQIKNLLNMKKGASSLFNRFLHKEYGIWIDGEMRKEEFESVYQIRNLMDIKYEYQQDYDYGSSTLYYVGAKSKNRSYPNACCIRKVISCDNDTIEFEGLLPMLAVDFVRNGQYTVIPFPFKYLREYKIQCGMKR